MSTSFMLPALFLALTSLSHAAVEDNPRTSGDTERREDDVVIAAPGATPYQVVLPDTFPDAKVEEGLRDTAALMKRAFAANGFELDVVDESARDAERPGIFLGNTTFARAHGVDLARLEGWSYVQKLVGRDLIIAGLDFSMPMPEGISDHHRRSTGARLGTTKGVTDFLYEFAGVRFLSPYGDTGIAFTPTETIAVPSDLDRVVEPPLRFFFEAYFGVRGARALDEVGFYMIANNYLPNTDLLLEVHSHYNAVPVAEYGETHPELFALIGGERSTGPGHAQYCVSNPDFQEKLYRHTLSNLDLGFDAAIISHTDGFRPCQCQTCYDLYGTGDDWGEKIWLLHRDLAKRASIDRPGKTVYILCYGPTIVPPKTFTEFPENTGILICGIDPDFLDTWKDYHVPQGFVSYQYIFGFYYPLAYLPQRSPERVDRLARLLYDFGIKGIFMDGFGNSFGLEGPTYYVYGRFFDEPTQPRAAELLTEYYQSAFGHAAAPMARFFDILHHALQFHSDMPRSYRDPSGRVRRYTQNIQDRMRLIRFLYPPSVLADLESHLAQAEAMADRLTDSERARVTLVRVELEHLQLLADVSNHDLGYRLRPDQPARDRLLDAVAAWQAYNPDDWHEMRARRAVPGWPEHRVFHGHRVNSRWDEPPFNWDVDAMRDAPLAEALTLVAVPAAAPPGLHDAAWERAPAGQLQPPVGVSGRLQRETHIRALYDDAALYLRFEADLPEEFQVFAPLPPDGDTAAVEALEAVLDPFGARERFYRLATGPDPASRYDAARGFIADAVHPLFGRDDPGWTGDWTVVSERDGARWVARFAIPYAALGVEAPAEGAVWYGNFGRTHAASPERAEVAVWSPARRVDDAEAFGRIVFSDAAGLVGLPRHPVRELRDELYAESFRIPQEWQTLELPLPLTNAWTFQLDPLEIGEREGWYAEDAPGAWQPIEVPAFWDETPTGTYLGTAWYRTRFHVPADARGRAVRLLFGAVDEQAWVYVNGELVRQHTVEAEGIPVDPLWTTPFAVDVSPEHLRYGSDNVLTVRVHNSIGIGGIWRPVLAEIK